MGLFRLFSAISHLLGSQRTLVRRLGGLALLLMGVHAAADVLDDVAYEVIDRVDFFLDESAASFLAWLSSMGGLTPEGAVRAIESFAAFVDLQEKDWLAIRLAFLVEILLDILLLDLAWGTRDDAGVSLWADMKNSVLRLKEAFSALDLERLFAPFTLTMFVVGGAVLSAAALEQLTLGLLQKAAPDVLVAGNIAAAVALGTVGLLVWRFLPDLLQGTLLRAHARGESAREKLAAARAAKTQKKPPRFPWMGRAIDEVRRVTRGLWLLLAGGVALAGLLGADLAGLVARFGAAP